MDNQQQPEMAKVNKPIYKRWWVWVLGILILFFLIGSYNEGEKAIESARTQSESKENTAESSPQEESKPATPASIKVDAKKLNADYEANEVSADQQYKGKIVEVSGTIKDIGKDILDDPYVSLESGNVIFTVQCMFDKSDSNQLASLTKAQKITLSGKVSGKLGNIIIKDCKILE